MDKATFTARLEQLTDTLFRVAWAILYNEEDCRDAMQEAALKAWQHQAKLRSEAYFGTWVTRILINEWKLICQGVFYPFLKKRGVAIAAHLSFGFVVT